MRVTHVSLPSPPTATRPAAPSRLFLFVILAAQLMVVLDTTIVNVALPHIQEAFGFSSSDLSWVLNAYILTFGGFLLLGARAGDLYGRRRVFLSGIALFTVSSLLGGLALSGWLLLAARARRAWAQRSPRRLPCPCSRRCSPKDASESARSGSTPQCLLQAGPSVSSSVACSPSWCRGAGSCS